MPDQEQPKRTTDERIDAIAMNLELLGHRVEDLAVTVDKLGTDIDQLKRVVERTDSKIERLAEIATGIFQNHERRIAAFETGGR